jgi:hypothetical protein
LTLAILRRPPEARALSAVAHALRSRKPSPPPTSVQPAGGLGAFLNLTQARRHSRARSRRRILIRSNRSNGEPESGPTRQLAGFLIGRLSSSILTHPGSKHPAGPYRSSRLRRRRGVHFPRTNGDAPVRVFVPRALFRAKARRSQRLNTSSASKRFAMSMKLSSGRNLKPGTSTRR